METSCMPNNPHGILGVHAQHADRHLIEVYTVMELMHAHD